MKKEYAVAFLLYFLISLLFLRGILTSTGMLVGNDWSLPVNHSQMYQVFRGVFWTWTNEGSLLGYHVFTLNDSLVRLLFGFLSLFQVSGEWFTKCMAIFFLTVGGLVMYYFCRYLKCGRVTSFLAGLFYITTPPFFNYLTMGWIYVLFSFILLPIGLVAFERTVKQRSVGWAIITALIYSLSLFQMQALSWFALTFVLSSIFLVTSRKTLKSYLGFIVFVFLLTFLLNSYWIISPLFEHTLQVSVSSFDFSRFGIRLNPFDYLRLWGSIFNNQFETALPSSLVFFSLYLPVLAYSALIFKGKNRYVFFFTALSFVPVGIFWARSAMLIIPYSSIFRDYSRNFILSAFAYSVLLAFALEVLFNWFKNIRFLSKFKDNILSFIFIGFWVGINILTAYPFWSGELSKKAKVESDVRLKTIQFSPENQRTEEWLSKKKEEIKALWLPTGGVVAFWDRPQTSGPYGSIWDTFAGFARKPGRLTITDRDVGYRRDFAEEIQRNVGADKSPYLADILGLGNVKYLIVRLNAYSHNEPNMEKIGYKLENDAKFQRVLIDNSIMIFENKIYSPYFYVPKNIIYLDGKIINIPEIMSYGDYQLRSGIFLGGINGLTNSKINKLKERVDKVFIRGELVSKISKADLGESLSVSLPNVRWSPGDFIYPLILKIEEFDKWKIRNEPEKLIEKHLFYASKRIAELEKWREEKDIGYWGLDIYQKEMEETIEEIKDTKETEKLRAYLEAHRRKIEQTDLDEEIKNKIRDVFDDLEGKIAELEAKRDFTRLVYKLDVPKEGEYEIYIRDTGNLILDIGGTETVENIGNKVETDGSWVKFRERNFEEGEQELVLPFKGISENLVDENLKIKDYSPNSIYRISFDYNAPKGGGFFVAEGERGETVRTDLLPTGEKLIHFEKFFKSSSDIVNASIHLSITVSEEKNLKVERIFQPEILLSRTDIRNSILDIGGTIPKITFVKINPIKYRVKVEGAREPYTLIFSESFHQGWKLYINELTDSNINGFKYYGETIASYFDGEIKEGTHRNIFLERNTFETWGKKPIPEDKHLLINGFANSWYVTPEDSGGKENYEIIVEFRPQQLFYIGIFISSVALVGCLSYLILQWIKNRKRKYVKI